MVEYGRKDRKIGLFQPSKCPKIPDKSGENGLKSRQNAEKNQRQNPGGGILKGRAWRAELVTDCHRIAPGRVQSPRGGPSSASGRRDAVQIGGDFPGGGRHRTAHGKLPGKIAPRKTGNKKEVNAARAVSTSFFASNFRAAGITRRRCCCRPRWAAGIRRAPCGRRKRP